MFHLCPLSKLRKHLGLYVQEAHKEGRRTLILNNGREVAAIVSVRDFDALDQAERKSPHDKEREAARQLIEFRTLHEALKGGETAQSRKTYPPR